MIAVTKLIDMLNKPSLLYWSNKIGLKGISLSDYYKETQQEGNKSHNDIENFIKNGVKFNGCEKLELALKPYKVVGVELEISNDFLVGRIDLVLMKDGLVYVCDFKRNKNIYLNTKIQLSTYKHMYGADKICYINSDDLEIKELEIQSEKYYEIIKRLYQVNELLNNLNERL